MLKDFPSLLFRCRQQSNFVGATEPYLDLGQYAAGYPMFVEAGMVSGRRK
jgi:hypothetical protein